MRIGELLRTRLGVPGDEVLRALEEQSRNGGRLCSLLISRGAIEFDDGARTLSELLGVPCVLARHLANRDTAAAQLIAPELARELCVLPIGRSSSGALIIAVRDPNPELHAALQEATGCEVAMGIAPATRLERLVIGVYGDHLGEFEVEVESRVDAPTLSALTAPTLTSPGMSSAALRASVTSATSAASAASAASASTLLPRTSTIRSASVPTPAAPPSSLLSPLEMLPPSSEPPVPSPALFAPTLPAPAPAAHALPPSSSALSHRPPMGSSGLSAAALAPDALPPMPDLDLLNPDTLRLALSPLDDTRVAKDPSQSGMMLAASPSARHRAPQPPIAQTLATTRAALAFADSRDSATDVAMTFISGRWRSAVIFALRGTSAICYRGHATAASNGLELPLDPASTLGRVTATKQASVFHGASITAGDPLLRILNSPSMFAVAPVLVAGEVIAVIAAGDSTHGSGDPASLDELAGIATALGETYERIRRL